jgi:hemoglobin-like flavoprotein
MFPRDLEALGVKLMDAIASLVGSLENRQQVQSLIRPLGRQHIQLGVSASDLAAFGEALLWTLEKQFGAAFTPELKQAWSTLYDTVQDEMLRGAELDTEAPGRG